MGQFYDVTETGVHLKDTARVKKNFSINGYNSNVIDTNMLSVLNISALTLFRDGSVDSLYHPFLVPLDYAAGTNINVNIYWSPSTTDTGLAAMTLEALPTLAGDTVGGAATIVQNFNLTGSGTSNVVIVTTVAMGFVPALSNVDFHLQRNGTSDSFAGNIQISNIEIEYIANKLGDVL